MGRFVELNHVLEDGMAAYPGLGTATFEPILTHEASAPRYEGKAAFYLGRVETSCNVGTYIDAPFHRFPDRPDLSEVPLDRVAALPGVVMGARPGSDRAVEVDASADRLTGRAVLIRTGWDDRWGSDAYWAPGPYLSGVTLDRLIDAGAVLVGVDFANVDDTSDLSRPAHTRLLEAGILIVEHLCNLAALPAEGFRFFAVPPRIVRGASFPVRAFAELPA